MTLPRPNRTAPPTMPAPAATVPHPEASGPGIPNINPATGLSTDYLNHFSEALMALEMVRDMPECIDDLRGWRPKTYTEHFAGSRISNRDAIIRMYEAAAPELRRTLDGLSDILNARLAEARDSAVRHAETGAPDYAANATAHIRPLIGQLTALIHGAAGGPAERERSQAAIDAMFPG
jgi:uncharacterized protein YbjQ (UPF0145 family)